MSIQEAIRETNDQQSCAEPPRHKCARCCMTFRVEAGNQADPECRTRCGDCGLPFTHGYAHPARDDLHAVCRIHPLTYACWLAGENV